MGYNFENKGKASEAGKKSKRLPNAKIVAIRDMILDKAESDKAVGKAFTELKTLKGKDYIDSLIKLLSVVIPKNIDLTNDGESFDFNINTNELIDELKQFTDRLQETK